MLLAERQSGPGRHRRRREFLEFLEFAAAGVRLGVAKLVEHELPLVGASVLLVLGTMCSMFAAVAGLWLDRTALCWMFGLVGSASYMFACGIFCIFPPSSSPRHAKPR